MQFAARNGRLSRRHRVRDNLPGTRNFCPLVRRTPELDRFVAMRLDERAREVIGRTHPDVVRRAAAFLLLADSRASFGLEGERPPLVFPVSVPMLEQVAEYRDVLADHSARVLPLVDWRPTKRGNAEVLNETADYYRYFDATPHAEFLYRCLERTVREHLPREVDYLERYDDFSARIQEEIADMPEGTIDILTWFLARNRGRLSGRARRGEFRLLTAPEVERVEVLYAKCFADTEFR